MANARHKVWGVAVLVMPARSEVLEFDVAKPCMAHAKIFCALPCHCVAALMRQYWLNHQLPALTVLGQKMEVFVSYASPDAPKVTRLVRVLKDEGIAVWFDEEQILPGDDILEKMRNGINQCTKYLICIGPSFQKKPPQSWLKHEFRMAILKEQQQAKNCIVPIRIKAGGEMPDELGLRAYADLTTPKKWDNNISRLITALR